MNPFSINPLHALAAAVITLSIGFGGGWAVNGWRLGTEAAEVKADAATTRAQSAALALSQLGERIEGMNRAASGAQIDVAALNGKLDLIRKDLKNAQVQKPLPAGCAPDIERLRNLQRAVDAANAAIQGGAAR